MFSMFKIVSSNITGIYLSFGHQNANTKKQYYEILKRKPKPKVPAEYLQHSSDALFAIEALVTFR